MENNTEVMENNIVIIKHRDISFRGSDGSGFDAWAAVQLLNTVEGVYKTEVRDKMTLRLTYDLATISLEQIEAALQEVGFHLDNSLTCLFRRALYYFTEENERSNRSLSKLTCSHGCAIKVFAARYRATEHGCRDSRPEYLRHYL
jgi:hypothetical protein